MSRFPTVRFKRGSDYQLRVALTDQAGDPVDLSDAVLAVQLRRKDTDALIDQLPCAADPEAADLNVVLIDLTSDQSVDWPISAGNVGSIFDIRVNKGGVITYSETAEIVVLPEVTLGG